MPTFTFSLYAIHLSIIPAVRLAPPSRFSEARKRALVGTFSSLNDATAHYYQARHSGRWPNRSEPEMRDLIEGHVVLFKTHRGVWRAPLTLTYLPET